MFKLNLIDPLFLPHSGCHIQLSLLPGEIHTLVGENGVGKTTLIHRLYEESPYRMTLVDQKPLDYFYDRTLKNIKKIFLETRESEIDQPLFLKCWNDFGLSLKEERLQSSLSGGEGQMLKICLGLAATSDIYVLDEPTQYLDESMKKVLGHVLGELRLNKKAVLMVEHDLSWMTLPMRVTKLHIKHEQLLEEKSWTI